MVPTQKPPELRPSLSYFKVQEHHSGAGLVILTPTCLSTFQATFDKFDEDASGTMNSCELRLALTAAGVAEDLGCCRDSNPSSNSCLHPSAVAIPNRLSTSARAHFLPWRL